MCGIFCSLSRHQHVEPTPAVRDLLTARGPDASNKVTIECEGQQSRPSFITCFSTVLSLRGSATVAQPLRNKDSQSTLCWNGEAWTIQGASPVGNDTTSVLELLIRSTSTCPGEIHVQAVSSAMSQIAGPYAFVFIDASRSRVYFGRDFLGRRSLLYKVDVEGNLLLSSVTDGSSGEGWSEVEADGIYCIDLALHSAPDPRNFEHWGDFVVAKAAYTHIDDQASNDTSVGTHLTPWVVHFAHGKVGHPRAFFEPRAVLPNRFHQRKIPISGTSGEPTQRGCLHQSVKHSGPTCTLAEPAPSSKGPSGGPVFWRAGLHNSRKTLPRSSARVGTYRFA